MNAETFIKLIEKSPTAFHAVENVAQILKSHNFSEIKISSDYNARPGDLGFFRFNNSSVIAYAIGPKYYKNSGIVMVATHTDSPCLKFKPNFEVKKLDHTMIGVQMYGGGIWHTWFDRDLCVAGQVMVKNNHGVKPILVHLQKPLLRIPNLAVHFDPSLHESFKPNNQTHFVPMFATNITSTVHPILQHIAEHIGVSTSDIVDMDMYVVDYQPPSFGGYNNQYIFSPRLDNLFNVFTSLDGFVKSTEDSSFQEESSIRMLVCFDNEEVGSRSYQGAYTSVLSHFIKSMITKLDGDYLKSLSRSFVLSADQAHAQHPNYDDKHESHHTIKFDDSLVLKYHCNQQYATTAYTSSIIQCIAEKSGVPISKFVVRNDSRCGSTIGPILSSLLGIKTADVGFPMLSMHSIREMCHTSSITSALKFYKSFYSSITSVLEDSCENTC